MSIITTAPGIYFAPKKSAVGTLFKPVDGRTAAGYFTRKKTGITFHTLSGDPFAFLATSHHGTFFTSCRRADNGKVWYMYSVTNEAAQLLGIDQLTYSEELELAKSIVRDLDAGAAPAKRLNAQAC